MPEHFLMLNLVDPLDQLIRKLVVKLKIARHFIRLRRDVSVHHAQFGISITNAELFRAASKAYWELFVVDGSIEGAIYMLREMGIPSISAEMIVLYVANLCPETRKTRVEESTRFHVSSPLPAQKAEGVTCGG